MILSGLGGALQKESKSDSSRGSGEDGNDAPCLTQVESSIFTKK